MFFSIRNTSLSIIASFILTSGAVNCFAVNGIEKGYNYGQVNIQDEEKKKTLKQILQELLKESKEQSKLQKEIRDILKNEYNPDPKYIVGDDGKKCIANSSDKCFEMPVIKEVRNIPAINNALTKRDLKSVKIQEKWYAKYLKEVFKVSYLKGQAIRELGDNYGMNVRPLGTTDSTAGWDGPILKKHRKNIFTDFSKKHFTFNIYLGINKGMDMMSLVQLSNAIKKHKEITFVLIFLSEESKAHWEKQYSNFYSAKYLKSLKSVVSKVAFEENKIYTTPSLVIHDFKAKKDTFIHIGRLTSKVLIEKTISYMLHKNYIKRSDLNATKAWNTKGSEEYVEEYMNRKLGVNYVK